MLKDLHVYSDIFYKKRPKSLRPRMSMDKRAAQFAPFAALTGFEETLREHRRKTHDKVVLDNNLKEIINYKLQEILYKVESLPLVKVNYFLKDEFKTGGAYVDYIGRVKKIDQIYGEIIFESGKIILIDDIYDIDFYEIDSD